MGLQRRRRAHDRRSEDIFPAPADNGPDTPSVLDCAPRGTGPGMRPDGRWSYIEDKVLMVRGRAEPFRRQDRITLTRIAAPRLNPLFPALARA